MYKHLTVYSMALEASFKLGTLELKHLLLKGSEEPITEGRGY